MVEQFVESLEKEKKSVANLEPENKKIAEKIYLQASHHYDRDAAADLYTLARPNENDLVKNYRIENKRNITFEIPEKWYSKSSRIIRQSALSIDTIVMSEILRKRLESADYDYNGQQITFEHWFFSIANPQSGKDPNQVFVELPYNFEDANETPNNQTVTNEPIYSRTIIVPHEKIKWTSSEMFIFEFGHKMVRKTSRTIYMMIDKMNYWLYTPVETSTDHKYELVLWYNHNLNDLPITHTASVIKEQKGVYYRDSYLAPAYQYLDEVITSFSNDQGVSVLHNNPILVISDVDCPACNGTKKTIDPLSKLPTPCLSCNGTGNASKPGSHDVIKLSSQFGEDKLNDKVFYVNPDVNVLKHSTERWLTMLNLAKKSIYLDVLEDTGIESGVAKGMRMEGLKDLMKRYGDDIIDVVTNILNIKEMLYVPNEADRQYISIVKPLNYDVETEDMLLERTKDALVPDRYNTQMAYIRQKYRGDEFTIKAYELAYKWCPVLLYNNYTELQAIIDLGVYTQFDLKRRDQAVFIFERILEETNYPERDLTDSAYFEMADNMLSDMGITDQLDLSNNIFNEQG